MLRSKHSLENHGLAMLFAEPSVEIEGEEHRWPRHSLENHGLAMLFAELSVDHRGLAAPAAEVFN